jgi:hypothetical protein
MDDTRTRTSFPKLTSLARRTGVEEYRLAMFGVLVTLPVVSTLIAVLV